MDSVGGVVSRVAEAWEVAWWALLHYSPADFRVHRTWDHLAEMHDAYGEFRLRALSGAIALPKAWPGIEYVERDLAR